MFQVDDIFLDVNLDHYANTKTTRNIVIIYSPCIFFTYLTLFLCHVNYNDYIIDTQYPKPITFYTYSLFHYNTLHLALNMFTFFIYAGLCEYEQGPIRTCIINVYSIVLGAFGSVLQSHITHEHNLILGASAGIYGLMASLLGFLIMNWKEVPKFKKCFYILLISSSFVFELIVDLAINPKDVAYGAHIGGFIGGALSSIIVSRNDVLATWKIGVRLISGAFAITLPLTIFIKR